MPRFYFNLRNDVVSEEEEGMELPDLATAGICLFNQQVVEIAKRR